MALLVVEPQAQATQVVVVVVVAVVVVAEVFFAFGLQ